VRSDSVRPFLYSVTGITLSPLANSVPAVPLARFLQGIFCDPRHTGKEKKRKPRLTPGLARGSGFGG